MCFEINKLKNIIIQQEKEVLKLLQNNHELSKKLAKLQLECNMLEHSKNISKEIMEERERIYKEKINELNANILK